MKHTTAIRVPKARTIPEAEKIDAMIGKIYADWPLNAKMVEADADLMRRRHQIFQKAGFTSDQAMQLILRK